MIKSNKMTEEQLYAYWILNGRLSASAIYKRLTWENKPYGVISNTRTLELIHKFERHEKLCPTCRDAYRPIMKEEIEKHKLTLNKIKMMEELKR